MTKERYKEEMDNADNLAAKYAELSADKLSDVVPLMKAFLAGCEAILNRQLLQAQDKVLHTWLDNIQIRKREELVDAQGEFINEKAKKEYEYFQALVNQAIEGEEIDLSIIGIPVPEEVAAVARDINLRNKKD